MFSAKQSATKQKFDMLSCKALLAETGSPCTAQNCQRSTTVLSRTTVLCPQFQYVFTISQDNRKLGPKGVFHKVCAFTVVGAPLCWLLSSGC